MNKMMFMLVLVGVLVGGCGPGSYWYKEGATLRQAEVACKECYYQAQAETLEADYIGMQEARQTKKLYIPEGAGYDHGLYSDSTSLNRRSRYPSRSRDGVRFNNCMGGKGYRRVSGDFLDSSLKKKTYHLNFECDFPIAGK